jgi:replication factor C large subunit
MSDLFTETYNPQSFEEFVGQGQAVQTVKKWAEDWVAGKAGKPLLLHGPPGTGKTCLAILTAKLSGWGVFELNASNLRNKEVIEKIVAAAAFNSSFSGGKRLILLDEIDGLQRKDRGGNTAILNVIKRSQNPVILTANKIYSRDRKLDAIKAYCEELKFTKIMFPSIAKRLRDVCETEGIDYDLEVLKSLAQNSSGDLRAALLDLQSLSYDKKITLDDLATGGYREREEDIFKIMEKVFKSRDLGEIRRAKAASEVDNNLLKGWVEENIPRIYKKGMDTEHAFRKLSKADVFDGRIMRRQHWKFLRYSSELMTSGVALSKENDYHGWLQVQFPGLLRKLSASKSSRGLKKGLASKMSKPIHTSPRQIIKSDLPYLKMMLENKEFAPEMVAKFDWDEKEVAFLLNTKPERKKVKTLVEQAKALQAERAKPKRIGVEGVEEVKEESEKKPEIEIDEKQATLFG